MNLLFLDPCFRRDDSNRLRSIVITLFLILLLPICSFAAEVIVDKTSFIKAITDDKHQVLLITRPPSWGKTSNMQQLENFFSPNVRSDCRCNTVIETYKSRLMKEKAIFGHKEIVDKYFGKYPTIFLNFKIRKAGTIEDLHKQISLRIKSLYQKHIYLTNSPKLNIEEIEFCKKYADDHAIFTKEEMVNSLRFLEDMLHKHFGLRTIILVDEYDYMINKYYIAELTSDSTLDPEKNPLLLEIYDIVGKMLGNAIKNNESLHKAIITGTTNIEKLGIFTGIKSFREDSLLNPYLSQYFGFTRNEVIDLLQNANIYFDDQILQDIRSWYGGYDVGGVEIYHPNSIVQMINSYKSRKTLVLTHVRHISLKSEFKSEKKQKELSILLDGGSLDIEADPYVEFREIDSSSDSFYTLLVYQGFLVADNIRKNPNGTYRCSVRIPNKEYREIFERARIVKR